MKTINKGFVKVEKFEATQDENGNWVPVGEVLETAEAQNALSTAILQRVRAASSGHPSGWFAGSTSSNPSASSGDLTKPGIYYPQIFISEFPTAFPGSFPGQKPSDTATATIYAPNRDGFGLYHGTFRSLGYADRDSDESKTVLVIKHRFDPDISRDRSIQSIGISHITSLKLAAPFAQTSTQILDVTYTIEIDLSDIQDPIFTRSEKTLRKQLSYPAGSANSLSGSVPGRSILMPQSKLKKGVALGIEDDITSRQTNTGGEEKVPYFDNSLSTTYAFRDPNGYSPNNLTNQIDGIHIPQYPTIDYTTATTKAGMLLGTVVATADPRYQRNIHEWHNSKGSTSRLTGDIDVKVFVSQQSIADSSTTSAIQNVFPRNASNTLPYQDVDALATGTGALVLSDSDVSGGSSWTANEDGLAKKYRVKITTGGEVGVSEYYLQRRNWAGTAGNLYHPRLTPLPYANMQNTSVNDSDGFGLKVIPFADDSKHGYHGQNPSLAKNSYSGKFNENILGAGVNYKHPEFITYDKTGFTVMHMNDVGKNFEANFSQICQVVVKQNTARDIYVADVNSGLWKVERTVGQSESEATVTRLLASSAVDDTTCRGVQIKNDGTIWAVFDEEMCSSADDGSTWTVYNASTGTQFKLDGVADTTSGTSNPQRIFGFTMDRYNAEDRFFIPARDSTKLSNEDYSFQYFWWSRDGSATGTSDQVYSNAGLNYCYPNINLRAGNDSVWCSKGGVWYAAAYTASSYMKASTYKGTWYSQGYAYSTNYKTPIYGVKAHWWQDENGEEWVLGASRNADNNMLVAVRSDRFVPSDNTVNYSFFGGTMSGFDNNPHEDGGKRLNDGFNTTNGILSGVTNSTLHQILGMVSPTNFITQASSRSFMQVGLPGSSTDSAGSPNVGDWVDYGWNGSAWVEGSTSSKTTHASRDSLVDGLTIKFDGADAGSFVATEFYDGYVYNGILKDDATTFSIDVKQTYLDVDTTTDFASTVPAASSGVVVTEPAYLGDARTQSNTLTSQKVVHWAEQGNWSVVQIDDNVSYPIMMRSEQGMQGDCTITFTLAEMNLYTTNSQGARIGLTPLHTSPTTDSFQYNAHGDALQFRYGGRPNTTDSAGDLTLTFYQGTSTVQNTVTLTDYDPSDVFKIERTSGNVKWYRNNTLIQTSSIIDDNEKVNFFFIKDAYGAGNAILQDIELTYIDSDGPRVTVGDGVSTGVSNSDFRKIVSNSTTRDDFNEIFIDGVPATINYDYSIPPAGECTILPHSGKVKFDPSDAGATITGRIGYLKKF